MDPPEDEARPKDGGGTVVDIAAMYADALAMIPKLWAEAEAAGRDPTRLVLDLTDSEGKLLLSVPFTDILRKDGDTH